LNKNKTSHSENLKKLNHLAQQKATEAGVTADPKLVDMRTQELLQEISATKEQVS
jgi:hypothetical protein